MDDPQPHAGEVRIRIAFSGVNPGDVKKREDAFGVGMPYPRVIPHSDGSGTLDGLPNVKIFVVRRSRDADARFIGCPHNSRAQIENGKSFDAGQGNPDGIAGRRPLQVFHNSTQQLMVLAFSRFLKL
jgi:hypothetical protein